MEEKEKSYVEYICGGCNAVWFMEAIEIAENEYLKPICVNCPICGKYLKFTELQPS